MDAVRLSRLNTALIVAGGGLVAGHLILPFGGPPSRRVAFWTVMLALGALRGWREGRILGEPPRRWRIRSACYAAGAAVLAWAANALVHGT